MPVGEGGRPTSCPTCSTRRPRPALRGCPDHRRRVGHHVSAARLFAAEHIDAVEIDPLISRLGRALPSGSAVRRSARDDHQRRRAVLSTAVRRIRPGRIRLGGFPGAPVHLYEPAAGELSLHAGGDGRHPGAAQAGREWRCTTISAKAGGVPLWRDGPQSFGRRPWYFPCPTVR